MLVCGVARYCVESVVWVGRERCGVDNCVYVKTGVLSHISVTGVVLCGVVW